MKQQTFCESLNQKISTIKPKQMIFKLFTEAQKQIEKYQILYNLLCIIHTIQVWILLVSIILPSNGYFISTIQWNHFHQLEKLLNWFYILHHSQHNYTKDISNLDFVFFFFMLFFYVSLILAFYKLQNIKQVKGQSNKIIICVAILISIVDAIFIPLVNITTKSIQAGGWKSSLTIFIIPIVLFVTIINRKKRIYNLWLILIPFLRIFLNNIAFCTVVCLYCFYYLMHSKYTQYNLTTYMKIGSYIHILSCVWVLRYKVFEVQITQLDFIWHLIQILIVTIIVIKLITSFPSIHNNELYHKNQYLIQRIKLKKKQINIVDQSNYIKLEYLFISQFSQMTHLYPLFSNYINRIYSFAPHQLVRSCQDQLQELIILRTEIFAKQSGNLQLLLQCLRMKIQYRKNIISTLKQALFIYHTQSNNLSFFDKYQIFKVVNLAVQVYKHQNSNQISKVLEITQIQIQFQTFICLLQQNLQQLIHFWICMKYDIKKELQSSIIRLFTKNKNIKRSYQKLNLKLNNQYINSIMSILQDIINGFKNSQVTIKNIQKIQSQKANQTHINRHSLLKQKIFGQNIIHKQNISSKFQNISYIIIGYNTKITKASIWICKQLKYLQQQLQGKYQYQIWPKKMTIIKDDNQIYELKQKQFINHLDQKNTIMVCIVDKNGYLIVKNLGIYIIASLLKGVQYFYYFQDTQQLKQKMVALVIEPRTNIIFGCSKNFSSQFNLKSEITKNLLIQNHLTNVTDIFQGLQFNNFMLVNQKYGTNCFLFTSLFLNKNHSTRYKNCKYKVNIKIFACLYFKNLNILLVRDGHSQATEPYFYSRSDAILNVPNYDKENLPQNNYKNEKFYCSIVNPFYNKIVNKIQHLQTNKYFKYYFFIKVMVIAIIINFSILNGFFYYFSKQQIYTHSSNINNIIIFSDQYHSLGQIYRDSLLLYLINHIKSTQVNISKNQQKSIILKQFIRDSIQQFQVYFIQQKSYSKIRSFDEHNFKSLYYNFKAKSPFTFLFDILVNFQKTLTLKPNEENSIKTMYYLIQNFQIFKQINVNFISQFLWTSSILQNDLFRSSVILILFGNSVNLILFVFICILIKSMLKSTLQITQIFSFLTKMDTIRVQSFVKTFKASINQFKYIKNFNYHSSQNNEQNYQLYSCMQNRTIQEIDIKLLTPVESSLIEYLNIHLQSQRPLNQLQNINIKKNSKDKKFKINFITFIKLMLFIVLFMWSFYQLYNIYSKQIQARKIYQYQQFLCELTPKVTLKILESYYQIIKNQTISKNQSQMIVKDYNSKYSLPQQLQIAFNNYYIQLLDDDICNININQQQLLGEKIICEQVLGDKVGRNFHRIREFYDNQLLKLKFQDIVDFVNDTDQKVLLKTLILQQKLQIKIFQNLQSKMIQLYYQYSKNKLNESKDILIVSYFILGLISIYLIFWVKQLKEKSQSGVSYLKIIPLWVIQKVKTLKYIKEKKILDKLEML